MNAKKFREKFEAPPDHWIEMHREFLNMKCFSKDFQLSIDQIHSEPIAQRRFSVPGFQSLMKTED